MDGGGTKEAGKGRLEKKVIKKWNWEERRKSQWWHGWKRVTLKARSKGHIRAACSSKTMRGGCPKTSSLSVSLILLVMHIKTDKNIIFQPWSFSVFPMAERLLQMLWELNSVKNTYYVSIYLFTSAQKVSLKKNKILIRLAAKHKKKWASRAHNKVISPSYRYALFDHLR